jgi:hypothetical protein
MPAGESVCRCDWKLEQALCFLQKEIGIIERFVTDILPTDQAVTIDQKRSMQWLIFKIVERPVGLEDS